MVTPLQLSAVSEICESWLSGLDTTQTLLTGHVEDNADSGQSPQGHGRRPHALGSWAQVVPEDHVPG
jgi:hypothetical protein